MQRCRFNLGLVPGDTSVAFLRKSESCVRSTCLPECGHTVTPNGFFLQLQVTKVPF